MGTEQELIIPGLPDDIGRECLLRVPYQAHEALKSVCKGWRTLVDSPKFYAERRARGASEKLICFVQALGSGDKSASDKRQGTPAYGITVFDTVRRTWERLPPLPGFEQGIPLFTQCVSVNQKLLLIGGWNPSTWEVMRTVFIYDFLMGKWGRAADMPTLRSFFACAVAPDGRVYVAGGHDDSKNALRAAEVYDVKTDVWTKLPDMMCERDECHGVFADGKFIVVSGYGTESQGQFLRSSEVYDPENGEWRSVENMWSVGGCPRSNVSCAGGSVLCVSGQALLLYTLRENVWSEIAKLPQNFKASCLVAWQQNVLLCGSSASQGCCILDLNEKLSMRFGKSCKWIMVQRPAAFDGFCLCAAAIEI